MPLRDHFRPPVENKHSWDELHGMWPAVIVQQLFPILPEGYVAAPRVHLGTACEIDVSTYERDEPPRPSGETAGGHLSPRLPRCFSATSVCRSWTSSRFVNSISMPTCWS